MALMSPARFLSLILHEKISSASILNFWGRERCSGVKKKWYLIAVSCPWKKKPPTPSTERGYNTLEILSRVYSESEISFGIYGSSFTIFIPISNFGKSAVLESLLFSTLIFFPPPLCWHIAWPIFNFRGNRWWIIEMWFLNVLARSLLEILLIALL